MNIAFIPVRGGSKSIPLKNIRSMCGHPLVYWTVKAAAKCQYIDKVYVATDSNQIRDAVEAFCVEAGSSFEKVTVVGRSKASASDTASTESAMLEFAEDHEFDSMTLIQATSPLLEASDLDRGFVEYSKDDVDSVLSVVPQKRFMWEVAKDGLASPTNYDVYARPRRQDFDAYYVENGAFYITSRYDLLASKNRVSGRIHAITMSEDTFLEIDEPSDWEIIERLLSNRLRDAARNKRHRIKLFLTDCDGCLTDGGMYYSESGDELKRFDTRDGMGFQLLREAGIKCGIVTSEDRELNRMRAEKLKLDYLVQGCADKLAAAKEICDATGISLSEIAYMGDDVNDIPLLEAVRASGGLTACPHDARTEVRTIVDAVLFARGGRGAVREFAELSLGLVKSSCHVYGDEDES